MPFVWQRGRVGERRSPGAVLSTLHAGYAFSGAASLIGAALWAHYHDGAAVVFLFAQLVWISALISLILLNPSFLEDLEGRALERLGAANLLTLARIALLPLLLHLIWRREWPWALGGYVALGLTDVVDGWIARARHEESKLGFVLDPFGDILFHLGIFLTLSVVGALPWWVGALVAMRYGLLLLGCLLLYGWKGEIWIHPTPFGKATGLVISVLTAAVFLVRGLRGEETAVVHWFARGLAVLLALGVLHVFVIGWINFRRPLQGGQAVYRKSLGLLVGRRTPR